MTKITPKEVFKKLVKKATFNKFLAATSDEVKIIFAKKRGEDIPEDCKPGGLLDRLTLEERKELAKLTADDIRNVRADAIYDLLPIY
jgi:hypothetical protein